MIRVYWKAKNGAGCMRTLGESEVLSEVMRRLHRRGIYASAFEVDPDTGHLMREIGRVVDHPDTGKRIWWSE